MTAKVHLVRHCAHDEVGRVLSGRRAGAPLSAEGRAQAQWLAGQFARGEPIAAIHASPRLRAQETARAIADRLDLQVETVDAIDELDFGEWTGLSFDELDGDPRWQRWNCARGEAQIPGGETMAEAVARAVAHVDAIARQQWAGAVLCVSHCDIIRGVVAHYLGLGLDRLLAFDVDPGSVSTLVVGDWGGRLLELSRGRT
jgi:ribonuclease H / adenosylcobalamin/alpha-ribazole phosphatase